MSATTQPMVRREKKDVWDVATELDRVFDSPFELLPVMAAREGLWHPAIDVFDTATETVVELELPGIKMEDLELRIEENHLILEGCRKQVEKRKEGDRLYTERLYGKFHRVVHLPGEVDPECVEAKLTDGILTIRMPKVKRTTGKKIAIKEG
ncbi:MAG: Hsp20/alpha crystallin family protein [Verrucomicrobia bacterium]|nr:Hsp20/alpha crystallin family protein [Verrucomicrobiota bacterium]